MKLKFLTPVCVVYVPVAPSQKTKMDPKHRIGIYVGFDFSLLLDFLNL
jgi:hypothetical protein